MQCFYIESEDLMNSLMNSDIELPKLRNQALYKQISLELEEMRFYDLSEKMLGQMITQGAGINNLNPYHRKILRKREAAFNQSILDEITFMWKM